jgi:hypothetical protein
MSGASPFSSPGEGGGRVASAAGYVAACFLVVILLALAAAGCGPRRLGSAADIMRQAIAAQGSLRSAHMELDSELELKVPGSERSSAVSYQGDYEKPDRWALKIRSSGAKSEVIILGDRTFVKLPGSDSWTEKKSDVLQSGTSARGLVSSKYLQSASDVQLVDRKGGTYHLRFNLDMSKFAKSFNPTGVDPSIFKGRKATMEVWVLKDSLRIKKATMNYSGELPGVAGSRLAMNMELGFSDFNQPVSIEAPAP